MTRAYKRCLYCHHRIKLVDGVWKHIEPHPEHACNCKTPEPIPKLIRVTRRRKETSGISTYRGYCSKENGEV